MSIKEAEKILSRFSGNFRVGDVNVSPLQELAQVEALNKGDLELGDFEADDPADEIGDYEDGDIDEGDFEDGDYDEGDVDEGDPILGVGGPRRRKRKKAKKSRKAKAKAVTTVKLPTPTGARARFIEVTDGAIIINPPIADPNASMPIRALQHSVTDIQGVTPYPTFILTATPVGGVATATITPALIIAGAASVRVPYFYARITANMLSGNAGLVAPFTITGADAAGNAFVFAPLSVTKMSGPNQLPNFTLKLIPWRNILVQPQFAEIVVTVADPLVVTVTGLSDTVHQLAVIIPGLNHPDVINLKTDSFPGFQPGAVTA